MFKITTVLFMALSAVFAGLYFADKSAPVQEVVYIEKPAEKIYIKEKAAPETRDSVSVTENTVPNKPRVIIKEINPYEDKDLNSEDIEILAAVRDFYRADEGRDYLEDHPILFQRLALDPATQNEFLKVMADMRLTHEIRVKGWMTEEEKEQLTDRKKELIEGLENKVESILGGNQYETYKKYSEKSRQYRMIADMDKKLSKSNFNLNENQQDQLADILFDNSQSVAKFDWNAMRKSPEMMDEWYTLYKDSQVTMKDKAQEFLEEPQLKAFESTLSSNLKRYAKYISHYKRKLKSKK